MEHPFNHSKLKALNWVRIHQQVLFLSDVLEVNGKHLNEKYCHLQETLAAWSSHSWPCIYPTRKDAAIWIQALDSIAPACSLQDRLGKWKRVTHKLWSWSYDETHNNLYHQTASRYNRYGSAAELHANYSWYHYACVERNVALPPQLKVAQIRRVTPETVHLMYSEQAFIQPPPDTTDFHSVLELWGGTWMWDHSKLQGHPGWLSTAVQNNSLIAATDGSYMRHLASDSCSAAFIFECSPGTGRFSGAFVVSGQASNAYRGELLGFLAIHLVLRRVQETTPGLQGSVKIYCNCLGALKRVQDLPLYRIPTRAKHSNILKVLASTMSHISFHVGYHHITAHQDNSTSFSMLPRPAQLNCECDYTTKLHLLQNLSNPHDYLLPCETIAITINNTKITSDTSGTYAFISVNNWLDSSSVANGSSLLPNLTTLTGRTSHMSLTTSQKCSNYGGQSMSPDQQELWRTCTIRQATHPCAQAADRNGKPQCTLPNAKK